MTSLEARTPKQDVYEVIKVMQTKKGIELKSVVSLTTDGATSMTGSGRGLVGWLKEDHPEILSHHCIIHQSDLCARLGLEDEYTVVMEKMMKSVNFSYCLTFL